MTGREKIGRRIIGRWITGSLYRMSGDRRGIVGERRWEEN